MRIALALVVLGILSRIIPHPPNMAAVGAVALYAGARLPRRWALLVPIVVMTLSDALLGWFFWGKDYPFVSLSRGASYLTFLVIVLAGPLARRDGQPLVRGALSLAASTLFFVTTNFAVWLEPFVLSGLPLMYPKSLAGLAMCYAAAVPFFGNMVIADLVGTGVLFGLDAFARRLADRSAESATAAIPLREHE